MSNNASMDIESQHPITNDNNTNIINSNDSNNTSPNATNVNTDIHNPNKKNNQSTIAQVISVQPPPPHTTIVYVHDYRYNTVEPYGMDPADTDPRICCALWGFVFSWIPIIGLITFLCNIDAPPSSMRGSLSYAACYIASFVVIFNIIFWSIY